MLLLIVFAGLHFRYARKQFFKPSLIYDVALWISIVSIASVGVYGLVRLFY
jgi:manganese transport protein